VLVSMDNTKVLTQECNWKKKKVKEAIYIMWRAPTMNRDQGTETCSPYTAKLSR